MSKHPSHLVELAKHGAEVRLRELVQEARYLVDLFPDLRDSFDPDELPIPFLLWDQAGGGAPSRTAGRPRRRVSAAARKAASERMKKYWETRRKALRG